MNFIQYMVAVSVCLSIFYVSYVLISRKPMNFRHARFYLLGSIFISFLIPLSNFSVETGINWPGKETGTIIISNLSTIPTIDMSTSQNSTLWSAIKNTDPLMIALWLYITVTGFLVLRIAYMLALLTLSYIKSFKVHLPDYILVYNHSFQNTFSFFRWIFVSPDSNSKEDFEQILAHEKIHVTQFHSFDILLIELLTAVMWFNPIVWMIRNSMQLVHEYLADDGALDTGINPMRYQALLINQVAEERLVVLSSSFNNSLIKKRITMITKTKIQKKTIIKLLALLPVSSLLLILMALFNGILSEDAQASENATFSVVSKSNNVAIQAVSLPPDTIIKKTIIKKISKNNPNDTIVEEKTEIITGKDALNESDITWHTGDAKGNVIIVHDEDEDDETIEHRRSGERREVIVHSESNDDRRSGEKRENRYSVHVVDGDEFIEEIHEDGDSVKHIKIITKRSGDAREIDKDKKVVIRHSGDRSNEILYIVDGVKHTDKEFINTIDPESIESMNVVKGENAGEYTDGDYEGIIIVTTKKNKTKNK
jgi:hypothetical protein